MIEIISSFIDSVFIIMMDFIESFLGEIFPEVILIKCRSALNVFLDFKNYIVIIINIILF